MAVLTPGTSGTYTFSLTANELAIECFERCSWRAAALTPDMLESCYRTFNLIQSVWANRGVNLWSVTPASLQLLQGVATYTLSSSVINIIPSAYIRTWMLSVQNNLTNAFTTTTSSTSVTVNLNNHGLSVGNMLNVATPASVDSIVIYGNYVVVSVPDTNHFTITSLTAATSPTTGGTVPTFTTTNGSASVVVNLNNQPFLPGQTFNVQVQTAVGGLTLNGSYPITATTTNSFTINAGFAATSGATVTMNSGNTLIQTNPNTQPGTAYFDSVLYPLSRADWTALPQKSNPGRPTSFWFDKLTTPTITFWPVPDNTGPYQFNFYYQSQQQDANLQGSTLIDIPYRFYEAYCAHAAAHVAMKWRADKAGDLKQYSDETWKEASDADREHVPFYIAPDVQGYFT